MASTDRISPIAFRPPIVAPDTPVQEIQSASFADLVRMLAEGIADAQASLDKASAELVAELAETKVSIVPTITETIDAAGNVTYERGEPQEVSLLDIGVTPTFYQFSEVLIEAAMDLKIVENEEASGPARKRFSLFADTASVRLERKLNRDVSVSSKVSATLVPIPSPLRLEPVRTTETAEPE